MLACHVHIYYCSLELYYYFHTLKDVTVGVEVTFFQSNLPINMWNPTDHWISNSGLSVLHVSIVNSSNQKLIHGDMDLIRKAYFKLFLTDCNTRRTSKWFSIIFNWSMYFCFLALFLTSLQDHHHPPDLHKNLPVVATVFENWVYCKWFHCHFKKKNGLLVWLFSYFAIMPKLCNSLKTHDIFKEISVLAN